jgi:hypothetical protein
MDRKKFITGYFVEAAQNKSFHHKWMMVDSSAELIAALDYLVLNVAFGGRNLTEAVWRTPWLENVMPVEEQSKISHNIKIASSLREQRSQYTAFLQAVKMESLSEQMQVKIGQSI